MSLFVDDAWQEDSIFTAKTANWSMITMDGHRRDDAVSLFLTGWHGRSPSKEILAIPTNATDTILEPRYR
jgi:hypothetical protein